MDPEWWKRIQVILLVLVVVALARVGFVFYERRDPGQPRPQPQLAYDITADDYVTSPKIFPYDLKSAARELAGKTVWVRPGNALPYYRYNLSSHSADLGHQAGLLPPLARLQVTDVVLRRAPAALKPGEVVVVKKNIMTLFTKPDEPGTFAVRIGDNIGDDFTFIANDIFFFEDPHQVYKHWPADIWSSIDQHQGKKGMNELQMNFALGNPIGAGSGDYGNRWMQYGDGRNPVKVTFEKNRAIEIAQEQPN